MQLFSLNEDDRQMWTSLAKNNPEKPPEKRVAFYIIHHILP